MIWILILTLTGPSRAAITTQEFLSQEACQNAGQVIVAQAKVERWSADPSTICVAKDVLRPIR